MNGRPALSAPRGDLETELQLMQDDRARLAVELESATGTHLCSFSIMISLILFGRQRANAYVPTHDIPDDRGQRSQAAGHFKHVHKV